ncbi:MAG: type II secretion system F family protein [Desulfobacterales bacterium]|jgi:type IV pilus assembly protein PilC
MAIQIKQNGQRAAAKTGRKQPGAGRSRPNYIWQRLKGRVKPEELVFFFSQLSLMLEIQMPLRSALENIGIQTNNLIFKTAVQAVIVEIEEGRQLSHALGHHPALFKPLYVSMIKAGETGGYLKEILDRIVEMEEKRLALIRQIKTALTYPLFLCILSMATVGFIMVAVLPKFVVLFEGKEHILPWTTRFLIATSHSLREYGWVYLIAGLGLAVLLPYYKNSEHGQAVIDRLLVSGPWIARIANKIYTCELMRTLGSLMASRVSMLEALEVTRETTSNRHFRNFIDQIVVHVQQGGKFSRPLADFPFIPPPVKQMVATGEETGNLPKVLLRLATFYDGELERNLKAMAAKIEPLALLVMGGIVGLIVTSVILPIFKLSQALH